MRRRAVPACFFVLRMLTACGGSGDEPSAAPGDPSGTCEDNQAFVAAHQTCSKNSDCTIVGGCGGGFGFAAVQVSVRDEAQQRSNQTPAACASFDGPTFVATCEEGKCSKRPNNGACGAPVRADAGISNGCPNGGAAYFSDCSSSAGSGVSFCALPCDGPGDSRCGTGTSCRSTRVSSIAGSFDLQCGDGELDVWICQ